MLKLITYFILIGLAVFSCKKPPIYDDTPYIEFESFEKFEVYSDNFGTNVDSLVITVHFQDGDGNLGSDDDDINHFLTPYLKSGGVFSPFPVLISQDGSFPLLAPENYKGPIEGLLSRSIILEPGIFNEGDTIRYDVYIEDRKGNQSNLVVTDELIL